MKSKSSVIVLVIVLLVTAAMPGAAAPLHSASLRDSVAGPCVAGAVYDPACDVDHDGDVDIFDIQTTAGHWNQAGVWMSDNAHDHLGQTWNGANNPLKIQGAFGDPDNAPLVLSNSQSTGHGLRIASAGNAGVYVATAGNNGLFVASAGGDGVSVSFPDSDGLSVLSAGEHGVNVNAAGGNGVNIGTVQGAGVQVGQASGDGFFVCQAGVVGDCTPSATDHGIEIGNAQGDGMRITDADSDGIQIGDGANFPATGLRIPSPGTPGDALLPNTSDASGQWALFTTDNIQAGNVFMSAQTLVAVVGGNEPLSPGDVVAASGLAEAIPGSTVPLAQVRLASAEHGNVVGVVHSRMALTLLPDPEMTGEQDMRSVDGQARPGDYVAITVLGPARVKLQAGESIQPGQRLTIGQRGAARALQTRVIDGMVVSEGAATVGVALEGPQTGDGLVWVLVNVQ